MNLTPMTVKMDSMLLIHTARTMHAPLSSQFGLNFWPAANPTPFDPFSSLSAVKQGTVRKLCRLQSKTPQCSQSCGMIGDAFQGPSLPSVAVLPSAGRGCVCRVRSARAKYSVSLVSLTLPLPLPIANKSLMCTKYGAGSTGRCNTGLQFTRRSFKAQGLSRALIEAQSYLVEIGLRVDGQVGFLREVLS